MPRLSQAEQEERERLAKAQELAHHLVAFIEDPTDWDRALAWLNKIGEACPLWTLKESHFAPFEYKKPLRLIRNLPWYAMTWRSAREHVAQYRDQLGSIFARGKWHKPSVIINSVILRSYVWQSFRHTMLEYAVPFEPGKFTRGPLFRRVISEDVLEEYGEWAENYEYDLLESPTALLSQLMFRRAMTPSTEERKNITTEINSYLKNQLGVLRTAKESIPHRKDLFASLGREARLWLDTILEANRRRLQRSEVASKRLRLWKCEPADYWAWRLALPFLSHHEIQQLVQAGRAPKVAETAALLVHARFPGYQLSTVAKEAGSPKPSKLAEKFWGSPNPFEQPLAE